MSKTDLYLPDVIPLSLTRSYLPGDTVSRNFGLGSNDPFDIFIAGDSNPYTYMNLVLADGSTIHYPRISSGTTYVGAVYQHTSTPTPFYGSTIKWNAGWDLLLRDGTTCHFPPSDSSNNPNAAALASVQDRFGNTVTFTRGSNSNLTKVSSPHGRWISFTRDSSNRITQAQDNIGRTVTYTYDSSGRLATVTDPNGGVTSYGYDASNRMLTIQDARGIVYLTNQYDGSGRITKQTQADNSTYQFSYTSSGGVITEADVTDPRGIIRRVTFNSAGYTLTDTHALGLPEQQTTTYTLLGGSNLPIMVTDALNRQTVFSYDSFGKITNISKLYGTPNVVTTSFTYANFDLLSSITDALNHTTSLSYDSLGSLVTITDPLQHQTTFTNSGGEPTSITDPLGNTAHFSYDGGDLVSIVDPLGNTSTRFVDNGGRVLSSTDPLGHLTRYQYDALDEITGVTDSLGATTAFAYDRNGNLLSVTDANNHATIYAYDGMDRLSTRTDPLNNSEGYSYDAAGNISTFTDRRGKVTSYIYDALNRRTFAGFGTITGTPTTYESTISYSYDAGDRPSNVVDSAAGTIVRTFDGLDQLTSEVTPQGTVSYAYDVAGRRTSMTVGGQATVNYTYDNANRLTQMTQGTSTSVSFAYDNANRRTSLTLPNGIIMNYSYDSASQLSGITYTLSSNTLGNLAYIYDLAGRRTAVSGSFARTGLPNPVSTTAYNANNQLTMWGTANLFYDANGNMTSDGTHSYTWDARSRLSQIDLGNTASFMYDPFGRRVSKTIVGAQTGFLFDGPDPVQELSGTTPTANLLTGGLDEYFTRTDSAGARNFMTDPLGSTVALADSNGALQTQYTYDPFGNTTLSGGGTTNSFAYTGRELDAAGVYYYRERYYSPTLQRFVSEDPIGFGGGQSNLYAYVGDNPLNRTDPTGMLGYWGPPTIWDGLILSQMRPPPPPPCKAKRKCGDTPPPPPPQPTLDCDASGCHPTTGQPITKEGVCRMLGIMMVGMGWLVSPAVEGTMGWLLWGTTNAAGTAALVGCW